MTSPHGIHVAVVGLGFGAVFVPIFLAHPDVASVTIADTDPALLERVGERYGIDHSQRLESLERVLATPAIDAVHLVTQVPLHAEQTIATLAAGKHCACAVPMATTLEELRAVIAAQRDSGKRYMMMETAVYTREYLFAKELLDQGAFGKLSFLRGSHLQDLENYPAFWAGFPPMHYITHAIAPLLALTATRATAVHCLGSGALPAERQRLHGNPFPVETAIFQLAGTNVVAEVTRSLFQTARSTVESFSVYGDTMSFEWPQLEEEDPVLFTMEEAVAGKRGSPVQAERVKAPYRPDLLPAEIAAFTVDGGHGGSHPHLVHEFISSIIADRPPAIDAVTAADWTAPGICAHESAMQNGAAIPVPSFHS